MYSPKSSIPTSYTVGGTCHDWLGAQSGNKDTQMATSYRTVEAYETAPYLRHEKLDESNKLDSQEEEKRRHD